MDPVFIIVAAVIIVGIIVIAGNFKKKNSNTAYVTPVSPEVTQTVTPTVAPVYIPPVIEPVTQTVIPTVTQIVTPTPTPVVVQPTTTAVDPIANTADDPWISHSNIIPDKWPPATGVTFDQNSNPTPQPIQSPQVVVNEIPSGAYGNWQAFKISDANEPWKQAFNLLADKDPLIAFRWGYSHQNPHANELTGEIDKWFFGAPVNPATGNSWPTSLGNKIIDVYGSDRGANTRRILGLPEDWYPVEDTVIGHLLPKYPKMWSQTDEQYAQAPGIPLNEWDTPAMLNRFK